MGYYELLLAIYFVISVYFFYLIYKRYKDPLHPGLMAIPIALFIYGFMPTKLLFDDSTNNYFSYDELFLPQIFYILSLCMFCFGIIRGSRRKLPQRIIKDVNEKNIFNVGLIIGFLGIVVWIILISLNGGLVEVYSKPYSGGTLAESGWIRETSILPFVGMLLIYPHLTSQKSIKRFFFLILFSAPTLIHIFLGARRGPLYQIAVVSIIGYYVFKEKRPALKTIILGGLIIASAMLFLVGNRDKVFLGSNLSLNFNPLESHALKAGEGNEYLTACATFLDRAKTGDYDWGAKYIVEFFIRPIPKEILPNKYQIIDSSTVFIEGTGKTINWTIANGSVMTLFSEMFAEFSWFGLFVLWVIGFFIGKIWRNLVRFKTIKTKVIFVGLYQGLLHLIAQDFTAMAVPFLLIVVPAIICIRFSPKKALASNDFIRPVQRKNGLELNN